MRKPKHDSSSASLTPDYRVGQAPITFFVDQETRHAFKLLCVQSSTDQSKVLRSFIERCLKSGAVPE